MKTVILKFIRFYQKTRFFHGTIARQLFLTDQDCRFVPTCSEYTYQAVKNLGLPKDCSSVSNELYVAILGAKAAMIHFQKK